MTDNLHLGDRGCHPSRQTREEIGGELEIIFGLSSNEAFYLSMIT